MAIKWKGWTARRPVKIGCVLLIPIVAFVFLWGCLGMARVQGGHIDEEILFTDFKDNDYFFNNYVLSALSQAQIAGAYRSEEDILGMQYLAWEPTDEWELSPDDTEIWMTLASTGPFRQTWGSVRASDLEGAEAKWMVQGAINHQRDEYLEAMDWLNKTEGLYYRVADEHQVLTNLPQADADFFRGQPVYLMEDSGRRLEQSQVTSSQAYYSYNYAYIDEPVQNQSIYIAFSREAVDAQNARWQAVQGQVGRWVAMIAASALAAAVLLTILIAGAGRRYEDSPRELHLTALDKPWLDLGLAALIAGECALCVFVAYSAEMAWRYGNLPWIYAFCALLAVCFPLPILGWILSFARRCKAGKWWRHTLIHRLYSGCRGFVRSLWAGFPLTAKAVLAGIVLFVTMAVVAEIGWSNVGYAILLGLGFTVAVTVLLLRYVRRLHLVERGAAEASAGSHGVPIPVTGGELGSIAQSIHSISEGINAAVTERMKSERLKTELITNVSHDIRTPLTSLITYTDLLKSEGLRSEQAPEYLEVLIQKSARLKTLTDDLFEAAKAASGSIEAHPVPLDLADFVRQVLGEMDQRVNESGLDFRLDLPEHAPVRADGKLLWRVMENLLSNVFKYVLEGSRVYIDVTAENGGYRLDLKNISRHPLNVDPLELTDRFKRGDSARSDEGSGLGLSIAQSFVQAQGGRFTLSIDGDLFKATLYLPGEPFRQA